MEKTKKSFLEFTYEEERSSERSYGVKILLVLVGLEKGEVGEVAIEGGLKLRVLGLELGEFGGEGDVLLLEERASLLGGDGAGVGLCPNSLHLLEQLSYVGVRLLRYRTGVVRLNAPPELLLCHKQRHIFFIFWVSIPKSQQQRSQYYLY